MYRKYSTLPTNGGQKKKRPDYSGYVEQDLLPQNEHKASLLIPPGLPFHFFIPPIGSVYRLF